MRKRFRVLLAFKQPDDVRVEKQDKQKPAEQPENVPFDQAGNDFGKRATRLIFRQDLETGFLEWITEIDRLFPLGCNAHRRHSASA